MSGEGRDLSRTGEPPSSEGLPAPGNGLAFSRDPVEAMESWAAHGDLVRLRFMGESMYMVTHPDLIEQSLVEDQHTSPPVRSSERPSLASRTTP